jgi:excinuclease ABC subunit A
VAAGTPEEIAQSPGSYTGRYLKPVLDAHAGRRARGGPAGRDGAATASARGARRRRASGDLLGNL